MLGCGGGSYLLLAEGDGVFKQGPDDRLGAAWGGQGALVAVVGGQVLPGRDQLVQADGGQAGVAI